MLGGKKMFLLLVDDHSLYMWLVLLGAKDNAAAAIRWVQAGVKNEKKCTLRALRTDRGGEFNSTEFAAYCYCADHEVKRQLSAPYFP
jgi:hypothetical protein